MSNYNLSLTLLKLQRQAQRQYFILNLFEIPGLFHSSLTGSLLGATKKSFYSQQTEIFRDGVDNLDYGRYSHTCINAPGMSEKVLLHTFFKVWLEVIAGMDAR